MSDPWEDVRERLESHSSAKPYTSDVSRLLADADALLAVKAELEELIASSTGVDGLHLNGDLATWDELLNGPYRWLRALAALPEHLRGDSNERSRKA